MSTRSCPACGKPLPERALGDEDRDGFGDGDDEPREHLPDHTPTELRRFCAPCRERLLDSE